MLFRSPSWWFSSTPVPSHTAISTREPNRRGRHLGPLVAALLTTMLGPSADAQVTPLGPPVQIDTSGTLEPQDARIASDAAGDYTVVWTHNFGEKVVARRFTTAGQPLDAVERVVASSGVFSYADLDLAIDPSGLGVLGFVREVNGQTLLVQQLDLAGLPVGAPVAITGAGESPRRLDVAAADDGDFAVIWRATTTQTTTGGTFVELFDVQGAPLGGYQVAAAGPTADTFQEPAVAFAPGDLLFTAWDLKTGGALPDRQAHTTVVDLQAATQTTTRLEVTQFDDQRQPLVTPLAGGGAVVVWNQIRRFSSLGPEWSQARALRFDPMGDPVGSVQEIGDFFATALVPLPDGGLVVVADDTPDTNRREGVLGRRFDSLLQPVGDLFWIEADPTIHDARATATADGFVVAWVDSTSAGVFTRAYAVDPPASAITVTSPNGGETILRESFHDITWDAPTLSGRVDIELSRDGGSTWEMLRANTANDGLWSWRVQGASTHAGLIRIVSVDDPQEADVSDGLFTIPTPQIAVLTPNGGESWPMQTPQQITWTMTDIAGPVRLELSRDGGASWELLASQTANDGLYGWSVDGPPNPDLRVRAASYWDPTVSDTSDASFAIPTPQLEVLGPDGGETLTIGPFASITWSMTDVGGPVSLELSRDGGATWELIDDETPNDGQASWQVTGPATTQALIRLRSFARPTYTDVSDTVFTLADP